MDTLPDDVARVVEELLGAKEIGALGCASKRWRPHEKTWERVAKRDPLTHCAVVVRIVRDAAGAAVDLVIEEFNWEDRSPRFAQIRMNFL